MTAARRSEELDNLLEQFQREGATDLGENIEMESSHERQVTTGGVGCQCQR